MVVKTFRIKPGKLSIKDVEDAYLNQKNSLLKFAYVLVDNVENAEDIVQDVFLGFARAAGAKENLSNIKGYLITAVLNKARNYYRDNKKSSNETLDCADEIPSNNKSPEQWAIFSEQLQLLSKAMGELPIEQREVVSLYMDGCLTFKQIAQIQEASTSTVQGRFRYGIEKLQHLLRNEVTK
ncbi:MAG: sigma-70 family RNA polymerase sigma factor [Sedimentisphaerales bacterium]|nr:sigma-70 family RNA polymerase sigma factor [Sedimentisphaerales bacterium]